VRLFLQVRWPSCCSPNHCLSIVHCHNDTNPCTGVSCYGTSCWALSNVNIMWLRYKITIMCASVVYRAFVPMSSVTMHLPADIGETCNVILISFIYCYHSIILVYLLFFVVVLYVLCNKKTNLTRNETLSSCWKTSYALHIFSICGLLYTVTSKQKVCLLYNMLIHAKRHLAVWKTVEKLLFDQILKYGVPLITPFHWLASTLACESGPVVYYSVSYLTLIGIYWHPAWQ